jgi:hypothetical protein
VFHPSRAVWGAVADGGQTGGSDGDRWQMANGRHVRVASDEVVVGNNNRTSNHTTTTTTIIWYQSPDAQLRESCITLERQS